MAELVKIWNNDEYSYEAAYGFIPTLALYLHNDGKVHPGMLLIPGGGYCMVCNVEGEPVGDEFFNMGMNVFILTYTTDITMSVPLKKQPLCDAVRAMRYIRKNSEKYAVDPEKLSVCGFSAGGHLAASLITHYDDVKDPNPELDAINARPDSAFLCYPVITAGEKTHIYSIQALLGKEPTKEELDYFSLEKQVKPDTPPCFIWQTVEDACVPVENSMMFAEALKEKNIPYAYYAFPHGRHGLSAGNDRSRSGDFGEPYTFDQVNAAVEAVRTGKGVNVSKERRDELMIQFFGNLEGIKEDRPAPPPFVEPVWRDVCIWPQLAKIWLEDIKMI